MTITSPLDLSGCAMWLDAQQETFADGDPVDTWTDRSGNVNHATASGTDRPLFDQDVIHGLPGLIFDGTHIMNCPAIFDTAGGTTFLLQKHHPTGTSSYLISAANPGGSSASLRWYMLAESGRAFFAIGPSYASSASTWGVQAYGLNENEVSALMLRSNGTVGDAGKTCAPRRAAAFTDGPYTGAASTARIGGFIVNTFRVVADIGEIIHYSRALTDLEVDDVMAYLRTKWSIECRRPTLGRIGF